MKFKYFDEENNIEYIIVINKLEVDIGLKIKISQNNYGFRLITKNINNIVWDKNDYLIDQSAREFIESSIKKFVIKDKLTNNIYELGFLDE